jgi:EAL domain-containing protein (putative c-di-GMP-specific phosphodiesterase class I)/PleD family two-component response regulator
MSKDVWAATGPAGFDELEAVPTRSPLLDAMVMMVDDEPLMTDLIQAYLEHEGYVNFVVTNDPREAMAMLRQEDPGVLLLDLMMPNVSGFDLLKAIRADRELRYTPVIVLTAATNADSKLQALQLGATDFLSKPVDPSELVLRVRNTLAFRQYNNRLLNYDMVTGLPNQRLFDRGINDMLANREMVGGVVVLFSVLVPACRELNDNIDQTSAQELATTIARRLTRFAIDNCVGSAFSKSADRAPKVARLGREHFALVCEGIPDVDSAEALAKQLLAVTSETVVIGFHEVVPSTWLGVALSSADGKTAEALRQSADRAATSALQQASLHFVFASPELNARFHQRRTLGSQLRGAAERGELVLHYQPKVVISSGRIFGVEALVRWQHPEHGLLAPGRFISLAEELDLIESIGQWVMARACSDVARWAREGYGFIKVAVNVAKPQFVSGNLCESLQQALQSSGLPARQLVIELTESMVMDNVALGQAKMTELKSLGVSLSIDDFGTGYSSLSYLKWFPIDELKIDKSFVDDLPGNSSDVAIVRAVIDLGHRLGLSVIAEGVEALEQLACLGDIGCDNYQGFLFSKPVPEDQLIARLVEENARFGSVVSPSHG